MDGGGGGGEGEAGDAVPKTRTPHRDVGKNRLKYQHVGCKLQPLEATFLYFSQIFVCVCGSRYLKIIHIENWMGLEIAGSVGPLLIISACHAHDVYFW